MGERLGRRNPLPCGVEEMGDDVARTPLAGVLDAACVSSKKTVPPIMQRVFASPIPEQAATAVEPKTNAAMMTARMLIHPILFTSPARTRPGMEPPAIGQHLADNALRRPDGAGFFRPVPFPGFRPPMTFIIY